MQPEEVAQAATTIESATFYISVFASAACIALCRGLSEGRLPFNRLIGSSVSSGVIGFCCVAFMVRYGDVGTRWYFLAASSLIGLFSNEQDKIGKALLSKALRIGKILTDTKEEESDK